MKDSSFEWAALDNAGKFFALQNTNRWSNVYRMAIQLKEDIDPDILKTAVEKTLDRLPYFKVRMRHGFFGSYLERNEMDCPVRPDIKNFCYRINYRENNGYLFRVFYHKNRISLDVYHVLCDGFGVTTLLCTLTGEYLRLKGCEISVNQFVLDIDESPKAEEYEEAYEKYAQPKGKCNLLETTTYKKKGTKLPTHINNYTAVTMSFRELYDLSKSYGVTVTELLAAVLTDVLFRIQLSDGKSKKDISVQIPVNLRKGFPSISIRNFVISLMVKICPKKRDYTFEEIAKTISEQLRTVNNMDFLQSYITQSVNLQTKTLRFVPLAVKTFFAKIALAVRAEYSTSVLLSNVGPLIIPEDMKKYVEKAFVFTGPGIVNGCRCGVVSVGDNITLTFSDCYKETDIERAFLKSLSEKGISVTVESNTDMTYGDIPLVTDGDKDTYSDKIFIPTKKDKVKFKKNKIDLKERLKRVFHT